MIHPDAGPDDEFYEDSQRAFVKAHPHRDHSQPNNDQAAIEWRHGYITGRRATPKETP